MAGFRPRFFVVEGDPGDHNTGSVDEVRTAGSSASADVRASDIGTGSVVTLDAGDSQHAVRVLRLRPGDQAEAVVGAAVYAAEMLPDAGERAGRAVRLRLGKRLEGPEAGAHYDRTVALVQALVRPSALEWSIEKSTEAGVSLVILVQTDGSPRQSGGEERRHGRWTRIVREAAKQSKQPAIPPVDLASSLDEALQRVRKLRLLPVLLDPGAALTLYELVTIAVSPGRSPAPTDIAGPVIRRGSASVDAAWRGVGLWIGPESGWTPEEKEDLTRSGLEAARLGRGVLRTETAGPVAVAVARLALGDW